MKNELILVDTTVWIHFLRGAGTLFKERMTPLIVADRLATAQIVIMELVRGAKSQKEFDKLETDFAALHCCELSKQVWKRAYKLGYTLKNKGITIPLADTLIASLALEYNLLLLHDDKHYEMIASVVPLKHECLKP